MSRFFIAATPLALVAGAHAAFVTATYVGPNGGSWSVAANWSPAVVPNDGADTYHAVINFPGTVNMPAAVAITQLTLGPASTVVVANGIDPVFSGPTFTNDGLYRLSSGGSFTQFQLNSPVVTFSGSGTFSGTNTQANQILSVGVVRRLVNEASHTINGSMNVGGTNTLLTNNGLIDATLSSGITLQLLDTGDFSTGNFNTGTLRASSGSTLTILNSALDNTGGQILADGGTVALSGAVILNGLFQDLNSGVLRITGISTLVDPTLDDSVLRVNNGVDPLLLGTLENEGVLSLESGGSVTQLQLNSPIVTFSGSGVVTGTNTQANQIISVGVIRRLVNEASHTINGAMNVGGTNTLLTNNGLIDATLSSGITLQLFGAVGDNTNTGTLRAGPGSTLTILNSALDNAGGQILADGGTVAINGSTIQNGLFRDVNGGVVGMTVTSTLIDPTLDDSLFRVNNGVDSLLLGTLENEGVFLLDSGGSSTQLQLNSPIVTFSGSGVVTGTNTQANLIISVSAVRRLVNEASHTINGAMNVGGTNTLLTNNGLIDATLSSGITLQLFGTDNFNTGTLRASAGSTLTILSSSLDNTGGEILADAGTVFISGSTIVNGLFRDANGGTLRISGPSVLTDPTIDAATLRVNNDVDPVLQGTLQNDGVLSVESGGSFTQILLNTPIVTLSGSGTAIGSNTQVNLFTSVTAVRRLINGPDHTISGSFNIGSNNTELTNQGRIVSNTSAGLTIDVNSDFKNEGVLEVSGAGAMTIAPGPFVNTGTVTINPGRTLTRQGETYQQNSGITTANGTLSASGIQVALAGGLLSGDGVVTTSLLNNTGGTIAPGFPVGQLDLNGPVTFGRNANFDVQIGGPSRGAQIDRLAATGVATLAGTIVVTRAYGYAPLPNEEFTVLTASSRVGTFTTVESCEPVLVTYTANSVKVRFPDSTGIVGDLDGNGSVDGSDLGILLSSWGPCEKLCCFGDLDGDQQVDGSDLGVLLSNWG